MLYCLYQLEWNLVSRLFSRRKTKGEVCEPRSTTLDVVSKPFRRQGMQDFLFEDVPCEPSRREIDLETRGS